MTRARAAEIYRADFWAKVRGDDLPDGLDMVAFDAAVNSGPSRGAKWLQCALRVEVDGAIGPETLRAARTEIPSQVIIRATESRMAFLRNLKTWRTFGKGWTRRVDSVRTVALEMAQAAPVDDATPELLALVEWRARAPEGAIEWLREMPV